MEDYKQKYENALEWARNLYNSKHANINLRLTLEDVFPELEKSEDERIRKELIKLMKQMSNTIVENYTTVEISTFVAWLEKQGGQKPQSKSSLEVWKNMRFEVYQQASGNRHEPNCSDDNTKMFSLTDIDEIFEKVAEKQGEQKQDVVVPRFRVGDVIRTKGSMREYTIESIYGGCYHGKGWGLFIDCGEDYELVEKNPADKIKPKFKVGDWIVRNYQNSGAVIYRVVNIRKIDDETYGYTLDDGTYFSGSFENDYHLWTIQDAKDGDVLATDSGSGICLFDGTVEEGVYPFAYCGLTKYYAGFEVYDRKIPFTHDNVHPATKEQRDLLFQKMKEAGYEWSDKDRKLIKIEQKSTWSEVDERMMNSAIWCVNNSVHNGLSGDGSKIIDWFKSLKERMKGE